MSNFSVADYMKRMDQLASKSLTAPEILASAGKRQPLCNVTANSRRTSQRAATKQDFGMQKPPLPQQAFGASSSSLSSIQAGRDTKGDGRSQDESTRHGSEEDADQDVPAFRMRTVWSDANADMSDLWTLKRATPVVDENDDQEDVAASYQSPTKKSRVQTLAWTDSVDTDGSLCLEELCRGL